MFERFTSAAREVVVRAQIEARDLDRGRIGTEHLLLAVLSQGDSPLVSALTEHGLTQDGVRREVLRWYAEGHDDTTALRHCDTTALRNLGIDLDDVRRRVEGQFGPGALDDGLNTTSGLSPRRRPHQGAGGSGHIPLNSSSKKAWELSLREAVALRGKEITAEHLLLGVLRSGGTGTVLLARLGTSSEVVRRLVLDLLRDAA